jgi:hypothetical protein
MLQVLGIETLTFTITKPNPYQWIMYHKNASNFCHFFYFTCLFHITIRLQGR